MFKINGEKVNVTIFPDKTSQVWKLPIIETTPKQFNIEWEFENESEVFHLIQLVTLIRHVRVPVPINLHMPYLPYGRQDKEVSNETTFALKVFGDVLKSLNLDKITTLDAHSNYLEKELSNFKSIYPEDALQNAIHESLEFDGNPNFKLAFPDKGARIRYGDKFTACSDKDFIIGNKVRNQTTGYIEKYEAIGQVKDQTILIVDDLCDGGATFIILTKELLRLGAKSVNLYVTHGIFSKGAKILFDSGIKRVFTSKGEIFPSKDTNYLIKEI